MSSPTWLHHPEDWWLHEGDEWHRSNWGQRSGQERILRVRVKRSGWDKALSLGVLTSPDGPVFGNGSYWQSAFEKAQVHVQWDTERSPRGAALDHYSIQVGLSRHIIREFVDSWILKLEDFTPTVRKLYPLVHGGRTKEAARLMPPERVYPVQREVAARLLMQP